MSTIRNVKHAEYSDGIIYYKYNTKDDGPHSSWKKDSFEDTENIGVILEENYQKGLNLVQKSINSHHVTAESV